jgi:hypothetical protein
MEGVPLVKAQYHRIRPSVVAARRLFPYVPGTILFMGVGSTPIFNNLVDSFHPFIQVGIILIMLIGVAVGIIASLRFLHYFRNLGLSKALVCPRCDTGNNIWNPWVCGFCHWTHTHTNLLLRNRRSYLEECKKCSRSPLAVICRECRQPLIPDDAFTHNPTKSAWFPDYPPVTEKPPVIEDRHPRRIVEHLH